MGKYSNTSQFPEKHRANSILDRLRKMVCEEMMIGKSSLNKSDANPSSGVLSFQKPVMTGRSMKDLTEIVSAFYQSEGFELGERKYNRQDVKKNEESYTVFMVEDSANYHLWVSERPYRSFFNKNSN
jgi:hypothetical protein